MAHTLRVSFVSLGFAVLALFLGAVSVAQAATITANITGNWSVADNWVGGILPTEDDDVVIDANTVITLDQDVTVNSIFISGGDDATGIIIPGNESLTVNGNVTFEAPVDEASSALGVGSGFLSVGGNLEIASGATGAEESVVYVGDGEIDVEGDITFDGTAASARLVATGVATIRVAGNLESSGTFVRSFSNVIFDGEGDQNVGAHEYYSVTIDKPSGTATLLNDSFMFGSLEIVSGSFSTDAYDLDITGPTTIRSGGTLTHGTGHKIQNGNLIIEEGGAWIEMGDPTVEFLGHVTNNGTFTAGFGLHEFLNFTRSINGTFSIPNVSLNDNAVYTNNGTLTISTSLGGGGHFINGAGATLNIGDDLIDDAEDGLTFTASAAGNTVNYNRAGAQTITIPTGNDYDTLVLSGSGTKTIESAVDSAGDFMIEQGVKAHLTGDSTANRLYLDGALRSIGVWGSGASEAEFRNNIYFSGTGTVTTVDGTTPRRSNGSGSMRMSPEQVKLMWDAYYDNQETSHDSDDADTSDAPVVPDGSIMSTAETPSLCPTDQIITQNLRAPSRNGVYNSYTGGIVTEMNILQTHLNRLGFNSGPIDGIAGPLTDGAIKRMQTFLGTKADGFVGSITRGLLNQSCGSGGLQIS